MNDALTRISNKLADEITAQLTKSGMMFRLFSRVKTIGSIRHKIEMKYAREGVVSKKMQDCIGIRIVAYFQDDVDVIALFLDQEHVIKRHIDEHSVSTFKPQRLNITKRLPESLVEEFRAALPEQYRERIDETYEVQVRTVFSEGWHEVEHDLRYKCKDDWEGCESYSRVLNGVIASLETAEWNMKTLFNEMARYNFLYGNYSAMLRNKMHIRLKGDGMSPGLSDFLQQNRQVAEEVLNTDRLIVMYTLLGHQAPLLLTYDALLFLINRIEVMNPELMAMEPEETTQMLDIFLAS